MPELTKEHLPEILDGNKTIKDEVQSVVNAYKSNYHLRGWSTVEGAKKWVEANHVLIYAPIKDISFGGFIWYRKDKHICYINTWHPRVYSNFVLLHEIYHIMMFNEGDNLSEPHLVYSDLALNGEERKADYFASILLLDESLVRQFILSLEKESLKNKIFQTMHNFAAPFKAVLIRLYELGLISHEELVLNFDTKYNLEEEFNNLGLDPYQVQKSSLVRFDNLEDQMKNSNLPKIAQENNLRVFKEVTEYFNAMKTK